MNQPKSNARRSQWEVMDRCLALLLRLMREPATSEELIQIVLEKARECGEPLSLKAAEKRFEEDRSRLRGWFRCEIEFNRGENLYSLIDIERSLIDLPPEALRGLAFLQSTFSNPDAPMNSEVQVLIERIMMVLPGKTKHELKRERGILELNLRRRDGDLLREEVWKAVQTACSERRQLEFDYISPKQDDGKHRRHLVEPYRYYFDPVRCHYYVEAYWVHSTGPKGQHRQETVQAFRMGRMANPHVLPKHFHPERRSVPRVELVYELAPEVARLGVTEHFPNSYVERHEDGSATVRTHSANLFIDLRTLLHYGANCRVIGGEKAVEEMKRLVGAMYERYQGE